MVEHLIDLVPRLLWLISTKLYYKYKLFRRFPASSLLAQSSWRMISSRTGGGSNPGCSSIIFEYVKLFFLLQSFTIWVMVRFKVGGQGLFTII